VKAMVCKHAGVVSWEYSSLIDALNRFVLSYFARNKVFYTHRSSIILEEQQIPFGKATKLYFFSDSDSEGSTSYNCWMKWSCLAKYLDVTPGNLVITIASITIIQLIYVSWLFSVAYHIPAHSRSLLVFLDIHRIELQKCIMQLSILLPYCVFGDAAFGLTDVIQVIVKGVYHPDDRSYNAIMSRIRVAIENGFAGQSNQFAYLSFFRSNKMGGRNAKAIHCGVYLHEPSLHFLRQSVYK
jgi:hypothetical protein